MEKKLLRKIHMEKLARLESSAMREADGKICSHVLELDEYKNAEKVFLYLSVGSEVDTYGVLRNAWEAGKEVYVPVCVGGGIMHATRLYCEEELVDGRYGIPTAPAENPVISPKELDFILVPGVCFDKTGNRLGRGGGYYDRYLAQELSAQLVGVCRSEQLICELSADEHDKRVDAVITEDGVLRIK